MGLVAPWHVGSPGTRDQTHVPCIGRRILNHCTTREAKGAFLEVNLEVKLEGFVGLERGKGREKYICSKWQWMILSKVGIQFNNHLLSASVGQIQT